MIYHATRHIVIPRLDPFLSGLKFAARYGLNNEPIRWLIALCPWIAESCVDDPLFASRFSILMTWSLAIMMFSSSG